LILILHLVSKVSSSFVALLNFLAVNIMLPNRLVTLVSSA
jgi:hypothetical protein